MICRASVIAMKKNEFRGKMKPSILIFLIHIIIVAVFYSFCIFFNIFNDNLNIFSLVIFFSIFGVRIILKVIKQKIPIKVLLKSIVSIGKKKKYQDHINILFCCYMFVLLFFLPKILNITLDKDFINTARLYHLLVCLSAIVSCCLILLTIYKDERKVVWIVLSITLPIQFIIEKIIFNDPFSSSKIYITIFSGFLLFATFIISVHRRILKNRAP